jgi:hypothetical protein
MEAAGATASRALQSRRPPAAADRAASELRFRVEGGRQAGALRAHEVVHGGAPPRPLGPACPVQGVPLRERSEGQGGRVLWRQWRGSVGAWKRKTRPPLRLE